MYAGDRLEFKQMLIASAAFHTLLGASVLLATGWGISRRYIEPGSTGPMNVMWASPVKGGAEKTAPNKLPGPLIQPSMLPPPAAPDKPVYVMPEDKSAKAPENTEKLNSEDAARRKAMAEALAKISKDVDQRPMPNADNFPSDKTTGKGGFPGAGSQGGIMGSLGGDPAFAPYKAQTSRIITDNFIWLQQSQGLKTEVSFRIDARGNILQANVITSSGNPAYDRAALRAVEKSSPLPPPPEALAKDIVQQEFVINFSPKAIR